MQRKRGTEFFDNSISVYLIVVFILVFGIMSCAKKESGTNDESYYTEERYYNHTKLKKLDMLDLQIIFLQKIVI